MTATFDLKARLHEMGLQPKKQFGQNFLVSEQVITRIVDAVKARRFLDLIEIGPGLGALTERLQPTTVIELDPDLAEHWKSRGVNVHHEDALRVDWEKLPLRHPALLVSNLPYQISTSLVIDRCFGPRALQYMILMFQKEVAQRLTAQPKSKEYGLLSVMAQLHFTMEKVAEASPRDFYPAPKVASRVLAFERKADPGLGPRFLKYLKAAFAFRRKFLLKNLKGLLDEAGQKRLPVLFEGLGLSLQVRAEELTPDQFVALYKRLYVD